MSKPIRIYLAAPFNRKEEAKEARTKLQEAGFVVTSRWIDFSGEELDYNSTDDFPVFQEQAVNDVTDIANADVLVMLNLEYSEGKMFELGLATAAGKACIIVGNRTHTFHFLNYPVVGDVETAIELIRQWENVRDDFSKQIEDLVDVHKRALSVGDLATSIAIKDELLSKYNVVLDDVTGGTQWRVQ